MFIFYSTHYPKPEAEHLVAQSMHEFGELMKTQPGLIFVAPYPFKNADTGTLMGVSIWESAAAFESAMAAIASLRANGPLAEWELKPTEAYRLESVQ